MFRTRRTRIGETGAFIFSQPYSTFLQDYGIITRVLDPSTEKMVVIASGIASYGTMAAGDFLTQEKYMKMVADRAPSGWEHRNTAGGFLYGSH